MPNPHDNTFKQLMMEQSFFEPFIKTYFPPEILNQIDWQATSFYKMGGQHQEENTQRMYEADLIYLTQLSGESCFIWLHCEHQSRPDKLMALRVLNYQTAELLSYARQNKNKKLPGIITVIYHQGKKPWPHSLSIEDLFADTELAMRYFGKPLLVDLPALTDEQLSQHQEIGPIEMVFKYVRQANFAQNMNFILSRLHTVSDKSRKIVLKYLLEATDVPYEALLEAAIEYLPQEREYMLTVKEQLIQKGLQQGLQQGVQQGLQQGLQQGVQQGLRQEKVQIAQKMLSKGMAVSIIAEFTGLTLPEIAKLSKTVER